MRDQETPIIIALHVASTRRFILGGMICLGRKLVEHNACGLVTVAQSILEPIEAFMKEGQLLGRVKGPRR